MAVGYTSFKNNIKIISLFVYGCLVLSYVIYIRFILNRMPRDLTFITIQDNFTEVNYVFLIFLSFHLFICFLVLYKSIKQLLKREINTQTILYKIIGKPILRLIQITETSIGIVFSKIMHLLVKNPFEFMTPVISKFFELMGNKLYIFVLITNIVRTIIIISFLVDVTLYFQFYYFYKSLYLLIIPLLINAWFANIDDWQQVARESINNFEYVVVNKDMPNEQTIFKNVHKLKSEDFQYSVNIYIKCITFHEMKQGYEKFKEYWNTRINILYYTLYLLGIIYIIIINII